MKKGNAFFFISTLSAGVIASKVRPLNLMGLGLSHKCTFLLPWDKKKLDLKGRLDVFFSEVVSENVLVNHDLYFLNF